MATETLTSTTASSLPFDLPVTALRNSPRKAFAHWVPSMPVSLDNQHPSTDYYQRNFLTPTGEGGKHAAYGGFLRDRPLPRAVRPEANWRLLDMEAEVRAASAAGLDGFTLVLYNFGETPNQQWTNANLLMQAARNVGNFKIIPQPDMSRGLRYKSPSVIAKSIAHLMSYSSAYRLSDGRYVLSPFNAESVSVANWALVLSILRNTYGKPTAFFPVFQDERVWGRVFDPISYGLSNWGNRNPLHNSLLTTAWAPLGRIATVHSLGQKWMQPISVQDHRPRDGIFDEAENTKNLRNTWELAIKGNAEFVHLTTWGDYPEGSVMAPTAKHGWSFLDINAYYMTKWKTGSYPPILRDSIYLTHRTQFASAKPSFPQSKLMYLRRGSSPVRDTIEALTFLKAPGTVTITIGSRSTSCAVPAGPGVCTVPLGIGTVSSSVTRSGVRVASVTSPYRVTATPYVQDLQYVAVSSLRQGTSGSTTRMAAPTPTPTPAGSIVTRRALQSIGDTYVNASASRTNYGWSASLASRGTPGYVSYVRYALPAAPVGQRLTSAVLRIRTSDQTYSGSASTHSVRLASDAWSATALTWATRHAPGKLVGTIAGASTPGAVYDTSLSAADLQLLLGKNVTLAITSQGADNLWFWSRNHPATAYRPQLIVTYAR